MPIQIVGVTDSGAPAGNTQTYQPVEFNRALIAQGNAIAERLQAHFMTSSPAHEQESKLDISLVLFRVNISLFLSRVLRPQLFDRTHELSFRFEKKVLFLNFGLQFSFSAKLELE
jgi:hypothetical protein